MAVCLVDLWDSLMAVQKAESSAVELVETMAEQRAWSWVDAMVASKAVQMEPNLVDV